MNTKIAIVLVIVISAVKQLLLQLYGGGESITLFGLIADTLVALIAIGVLCFIS